MSAQEVLHNLRKRGIAVNLNAGQITLIAEPGVINDADVAAVREHKPALIDILTLPPTGTINRPMVVHARRLNTCPWDGCRGLVVPQTDLHVCLKCHYWFKLIPQEGRYE